MYLRRHLPIYLQPGDPHGACNRNEHSLLAASLSLTTKPQPSLLHHKNGNPANAPLISTPTSNNLYNKIKLSRCVSTGVAYEADGWTIACTGKAASCGGSVAYKARGYKQGWADGMAGKMGKPTAQIEPKSRVARFLLVTFKLQYQQQLITTTEYRLP